MPTKEQLQDLNTSIDAMILEAVTHHRHWAPIYRDGFNYIYNNQLAGRGLKDGWDRIQVNKIFPAIMQEQGLLAQRRPKIIAQPWEEGDAEGATVWQGMLQWQFQKGLNMPLWLLAAVLDAKIYGHFIGKPYWEPKAEWDEENHRWKGAPRVTLVRPTFFGMDPDAESIDDAKYAFTRRMISAKAAKIRWPEAEDEIDKAVSERSAAARGQFGFLGGLDFHISAASSKAALDGATVRGETSKEAEAIIEGRIPRLLMGWFAQQREIPTKDQPDPQVELIEIFIEDLEEVDDRDLVPVSIEELEAEGKVKIRGEEDEIGSKYILTETGEPLTALNQPTTENKYKRPVYPNGRRVLRIGQQILNPNKHEQVWNYRRWPYVVGVNYNLPHTWHGLNGVEMPRGMQDATNTAHAHVLNYVKFFGDPSVDIEQGALQDSPDNRGVGEQLQARAGAITKLVANGINKIRRNAPSPMGTGLLEAIRLWGEEGKDLTGVQDVGLGKQTKGDPTLGEVQRLEANTRIRTGLQSILLDDATVRIMECVYELLDRNMQPGDMTRVVGEGKKPTVAVLQVSDFDARFDLALEVGTAMPFDRERRKQEALQLYQLLGNAYLKQLLEAYEVKDIEEVMKAVEAQLKAQAEAEEAEAKKTAGAAKVS